MSAAASVPETSFSGGFKVWTTLRKNVECFDIAKKNLNLGKPSSACSEVWDPCLPHRASPSALPPRTPPPRWPRGARRATQAPRRRRGRGTETLPTRTRGQNSSVCIYQPPG